MINLVDTHCHINFFQNAGEIALQCEKQNIYTIYVTTLPSQFDETYEYVKGLKYIFPSLGFHSLESQYDIAKEKELFLKHINNTQYIGEVGLDFSNKSQKSNEDQIDIFEFILNKIKGKNKLLSVHSNKAEDIVLDLLLKYNIKNVIFHWYSGKISTLKNILNHGYYFSINSAMCKSKKGQNIISKLPRNRVLVETDAPFVKNVLPYDNEETYNYLTKVWGIEINKTKQQVLENFIRFSSIEIKTNLFN
jgi:TatD DNase family protein